MAEELTFNCRTGDTEDGRIAVTLAKNQKTVWIPVGWCRFTQRKMPFQERDRRKAKAYPRVLHIPRQMAEAAGIV